MLDIWWNCLYLLTLEHWRIGKDKSNCIAPYIVKNYQKSNIERISLTKKCDFLLHFCANYQKIKISKKNVITPIPPPPPTHTHTQNICSLMLLWCRVSSYVVLCGPMWLLCGPMCSNIWAMWSCGPMWTCGIFFQSGEKVFFYFIFVRIMKK